MSASKKWMDSIRPSRKDGTNLRALEKNPRKQRKSLRNLGLNPRALKTNPRAVR